MKNESITTPVQLFSDRPIRIDQKMRKDEKKSI